MRTITYTPKQDTLAQELRQKLLAKRRGALRLDSDEVPRAYRPKTRFASDAVIARLKFAGVKVAIEKKENFYKGVARLLRGMDAATAERSGIKLQGPETGAKDDGFFLDIRGVDLALDCLKQAKIGLEAGKKYYVVEGTGGRLARTLSMTRPQCYWRAALAGGADVAGIEKTVPEVEFLNGPGDWPPASPSDGVFYLAELGADESEVRRRLTAICRDLPPGGFLYLSTLGYSALFTRLERRQQRLGVLRRAYMELTRTGFFFAQHAVAHKDVAGVPHGETFISAKWIKELGEAVGVTQAFVRFGLYTDRRDVYILRKHQS